MAPDEKEREMTVGHHVGLDAPYAITYADVERYAEDGFIKLKNVLSRATLERYEPGITSNVLRLNKLHLPMEERSTYQRAFLQVANLWRHSEMVRELVFSQRLARIAAELLGVSGVRLYHDQALYKEPGGGITPWHADHYYWPLSTDRVCTAWIPLQDTPQQMGPLAFSVGSHRFEWGRNLSIGDESETVIQAELARQSLPVANGPYELGDVSFHSGWTFHRAEPNLSEVPRRVMTIIYMDADITVSRPVNDHQQADLDAVMPGAQIGAVPNTGSNPVLYESSE